MRCCCLNISFLLFSFLCVPVIILPVSSSLVNSSFPEDNKHETENISRCLFSCKAKRARSCRRIRSSSSSLHEAPATANFRSLHAEILSQISGNCTCNKKIALSPANLNMESETNFTSGLILIPAHLPPAPFTFARFWPIKSSLLAF